jgi:Ribonucleotide reductase, barrel domain
LDKWTLPMIEGHIAFPHAYTHGFYCGDGSDSQSKPQYENCKRRKEVRLYGDDKKCLSQLEVKENCSVRTQKNGSLRFYIPDDMPSKFVVPGIQHTIKSRLEWLSGLYDADGSEIGAITSANFDFLKQIKDMLAYTGVFAKISKVQRFGGYPTSKEYYYNLYIPQSVLRELTHLGLCTERLDFTIRNTNKQHYVKVIGINSIENSETYCVTELKRGTALFNGIKTKQCAVAPTVSNSTISGGYSAGIEPLAANIFSQKSAKGTFIRKNQTLEKLLESKGKNLPEVWKSINEQSGSVQHLGLLSAKEKEIFLTAREINQHVLIKLAAQRQRWIDQAQSLNLFFASNASAKYIHEVHLAAWKNGLKTLYYLRSDGVIKGDLASRSEDECKACEA